MRIGRWNRIDIVVVGEDCVVAVVVGIDASDWCSTGCLNCIEGSQILGNSILILILKTFGVMSEIVSLFWLFEFV